ncbi:AcrR family transcriptional regulator [Agromyces terreus]|uniref:AcrR family transcriptional regulator n=1 Tax=Agromyces terreus TaxID=424795 RepID=A0A9X2GZW4_9MICO|nr:TetR/AcrR family transcriptional regulator [Agromyces terreus]MCP2371722.1 AcrR family transcriptional regulator [Agromyces terreus]
MPNVDLILGADSSRKRSVRTEPTQRRSSQRLDALLDAAADIVDESGFERLTTQMVAERAGASIGTVYRYFPDRVAVVNALRERAIRRYRERVADDAERTAPATWWQLIDLALDACISMYREEPGFAVVHAGRRDRAEDDEPEFAARMARLISEEFEIELGDDELRFRLGIALEVGHSLVNRAFERTVDGDEVYLAEARNLVRSYLFEHVGTPHAASNAA